MSNVVQVIESQFNNNFKAAINAYDLNRDGFVDQNELIQVLQRACIPYWSARCYVQQIFADLDKNHDGRLSVSDAQTAVCGNISQNTLSLVEYLKRLFTEQPQAAFSHYNTNHDCWVTQGEVVSVLTRAGVSCYEAGLAARQLFAELDRDHNGVLSLRELTNR